MTPHQQNRLSWSLAALVSAATVWAAYWHTMNPVTASPIALPPPVSDLGTSPEQENQTIDYAPARAKRLQRPLYDPPPKQPASTTVKKPNPKPVVSKPSLGVRLEGTVATGSGLKAMLVTANASQLVGPGDHLAEPLSDVVVQKVEKNTAVLVRGPHVYALKVPTGVGNP